MSTESRLEIEVKIRIDAAEPWRGRLLALGAEILAPRALERNLVFDTPRQRLRKLGILLRLRGAGGRSILTMKLPAQADAAFKVREETEIVVSDFAAMEAILRRIGFRPFFAYEKYREVFRLGAAGIMLDETPIGNFLEIEGDPAEIDGAAARLGFSRRDYIRDSYYRLFSQSGRAGDMVFPA